MRTSLTVILVLAALLAGCGGDGAVTTTATTAAATTAVAPTSTAIAPSTVTEAAEPWDLVWFSDSSGTSWRICGASGSGSN